MARENATIKSNGIEITDHAYLRMKERAGLSKKATKRLMTKVLENGVTVDNTRGSLHTYMDKKEIINQGTLSVHLYGEMVYLFEKKANCSLLITAYQLPHRFRRQSIKRQQRKRAVQVVA